MLRRARSWFAFSVLLAACSTEPAPPHDVEVGARTPDDGNGQTGSIGASWDECKQDSDCVPRAQDALMALAQPTRSARMFESGVCKQYSVITDEDQVSGHACECKQGTGAITIGPVGLGCYAFGRAGDCLWDDSEFAGCKLGETEQCSALCRELEARFAADAARTFAGSVRYTQCDAGTCHNVVEIEGHCYADRSYENGRSYACELGGEAILTQHLEPSAPAEDPPVRTAFPSLYLPEADGFVQLTASTSFVGTVREATEFGSMAQFYTVGSGSAGRGKVIDPLEGLDDCGVSSGGTGPGLFPLKFLNADTAVLIDGDRELPFKVFRSSSDDYYSYILELTELGVTPRFDADYGFRASGGTFGGAIELEAIHLPAELSIHELETTERVPHGPLHLSWSGRNNSPLSVYMSVRQTLGDGPQEYRVDCLLRDDGDFELPASVFDLVANGFVIAEFTRENRVLAHSVDKAVLAIAQTRATHRFAVGERCERSDVMDACLKYAAHLRARYTECGSVPAPSVETTCPGYLREACAGCSEYFDCMIEQTRCEPNGLTVQAGCTCSP
jgi:hypothetical protein